MRNIGRALPDGTMKSLRDDRPKQKNPRLEKSFQPTNSRRGDQNEKNFLHPNLMRSVSRSALQGHYRRRIGMAQTKASTNTPAARWWQSRYDTRAARRSLHPCGNTGRGRSKAPDSSFWRNSIDSPELWHEGAERLRSGTRWYCIYPGENSRNVVRLGSRRHRAGVRGSRRRASRQRGPIQRNFNFYLGIDNTHGAKRLVAGFCTSWGTV